MVDFYWLRILRRKDLKSSFSFIFDLFKMESRQTYAQILTSLNPDGEQESKNTSSEERQHSVEMRGILIAEEDDDVFYDVIAQDDSWSDQVQFHIGSLYAAVQEDLDDLDLSQLLKRIKEQNGEWFNHHNTQLLNALSATDSRVMMTPEQRTKIEARRRSLRILWYRFFCINKHFATVFKANMATGSGIGRFNDPGPAKYLTYLNLMDYLSMPLWQTKYNTDDLDINPFLLHE